MKLKLNKQKVAELSSKEMENVEGGAGWWSSFRTGHCAYSDDNQSNAQACDQNADGTYDIVCLSCVSS